MYACVIFSKKSYFHNSFPLMWKYYKKRENISSVIFWAVFQYCFSAQCYRAYSGASAWTVQVSYPAAAESSAGNTEIRKYSSTALQVGTVTV